MPPFLNDTFTDTAGTVISAHTGETGATWTENAASTGDAVISTENRARGNSAGNATFLASGSPAAAGYDVEGIFRVKTVAARCGITGRTDATADTMYEGQYNTSTTAWRLIKTVAGSATILGSYVETLTVGNDYTVLLEIRDATKKFYVGGAERISSADNEITAAGKPGIRLGGAGVGDSDGIHIASISATDPPPTTATHRMLTGVGS